MFTKNFNRIAKLSTSGGKYELWEDNNNETYLITLNTYPMYEYNQAQAFEAWTNIVAKMNSFPRSATVDFNSAIDGTLRKLTIDFSD